ncbi:MAG: glutamate synthase [Myxococcales bacterium]|nr:glutamate synthase [Myxococcales bacterium]
MSELAPMSLVALLRRALAEHEQQQAVFDLPARKWYRGQPDLDLSVGFHGERASTPLGPAAGPHSQLAQNIALSWLGGARIIELKTVQVKDDLVIPRPCIDATNVGYNVEWSQELRVPESLHEYAKAWYLIRALEAAGITADLAAPRPHTLFDMSVGYDLEGIRSDKVTGFLRGMRDATAVIDELRDELRRTPDLARFADIEVPPCLSSCVTLSTFHGCPAAEIEGICEYLLGEMGLHVVVKMNPTLLGYERVRSMLQDDMGYRDIAPIEEEFARDLKWDQALAMMDRLGKVAADRDLTLGAKFTNTLVVHNHRKFFPHEDRMYMSGPPLFPISLSLALAFREAVGAALPISFSAGIDAQNFPDVAACGLAPITTCTDLLRPGGYGRLFKYLTGLEKRMKSLGVSDLDGYLLAAEGATGAGIDDPTEAGLFNMKQVVARVVGDARYGRAKNASVPRKIGSHLVLFDCISCDKCVPVCPNDANFVYEVEATSSFSEEAVVGAGGALQRRPAIPYVVERAHQIGNYADFCNDCGNCDVFCPEDGGPYVEKPRFFGSKATFERDARHGGFYVEASADLCRAWARIDGKDYHLELERSGGRAVFDDGVLELILDEGGGIDGMRAMSETPPPGHVLSTHPARVMLTILQGVLDPKRPNPLQALAEPHSVRSTTG